MDNSEKLVNLHSRWDHISFDSWSCDGIEG